jgi:hypothetical protein
MAAACRPRPAAPPSPSVPAHPATPGHARRSGRSHTPCHPARNGPCLQPRCIKVINEQGLYLLGRRRCISLADLLHGADQPSSPERTILRWVRAAFRVPEHGQPEMPQPLHRHRHRRVRRRLPSRPGRVRGGSRPGGVEQAGEHHQRPPGRHDHQRGHGQRARPACRRGRRPGRRSRCAPASGPVIQPAGR